MIMDFLDYPTLRVIWWLLLGVLLIGFAITDGFDLGTGMLLPFAGLVGIVVVESVLVSKKKKQ